MTTTHDIRDLFLRHVCNAAHLYIIREYKQSALPYPSTDDLVFFGASGEYSFLSEAIEMNKWIKWIEMDKIDALTLS